MKNNTKYTLIILLIISLIINILLLSNKRNNLLKIDKQENNILYSYKRIKEPINLPLSQSASCNFDKDVSVTFPEINNQLKDKEIRFQFNKNTSPIGISFIDLDTNKPIMRGNAGQDDLIKIIDNEDIVTVVEKDPVSFGTLQSFSIFKKFGVAIWSKQYDLLGLPFGLISMGYCD
jgi:Na+-transporting NADH:ubiquinone oxidoreductase subunit NqrC